VGPPGPTPHRCGAPRPVLPRPGSVPRHAAVCGAVYHPGEDAEAEGTDGVGYLRVLGPVFSCVVMSFNVEMLLILVVCRQCLKLYG